MTNPDVLDPAVLDNLRQLTAPGEPDVLLEVLQLFLDEAPRRLERLQAAWREANGHEMQRAAHSLKGSSGNIGAGAMMAVCHRIDDLARAGDVAAVAPLLPSLTSEYHRAELEIKHLLQTS